MKRLVLAITLASLAALQPAGAAPRRTRACPVLAVSCQDVVRVGVPVTFTLTVKDLPDGAKLTYNWVVSAGTIESGQGASSVIVDTTGLTYSLGHITATVAVTGLPEGCAGSASCATTVIGIADDRKIDEYGDIRWSDEKARLDNYIMELRHDPTMRACMVCYGGRRARKDEARRRCARAADYVKRVGGIDAARVFTIDGGYREELTVELWPLPAGATPPMTSPTVDPSEVIIINDAPRRKRTPRRR